MIPHRPVRHRHRRADGAGDGVGPAGQAGRHDRRPPESSPGRRARRSGRTMKKAAEPIAATLRTIGCRLARHGIVAANGSGEGNGFGTRCRRRPIAGTRKRDGMGMGLYIARSAGQPEVGERAAAALRARHGVADREVPVRERRLAAPAPALPLAAEAAPVRVRVVRRDAALTGSERTGIRAGGARSAGRGRGRRAGPPGAVEALSAESGAHAERRNRTQGKGAAGTLPSPRPDWRQPEDPAGEAIDPRDAELRSRPSPFTGNPSPLSRSPPPGDHDPPRTDATIAAATATTIAAAIVVITNRSGPRTVSHPCDTRHRRRSNDRRTTMRS